MKSTTSNSSDSSRTSNISRQHVAEHQRIATIIKVFGSHFPMQVEPSVYSITEAIAGCYHGGYWTFYVFSNGGFYMAPDADGGFAVSCENGFDGTLSADALGITACLYAYGHLSFSDDEKFAEICAQHYHWLRDYMLDHAEAGAILQAID